MKHLIVKTKENEYVYDKKIKSINNYKIGNGYIYKVEIKKYNFNLCNFFKDNKFIERTDVFYKIKVIREYENDKVLVIAEAVDFAKIGKGQ